MLTHALELASRGLAVHWLYQKAKNPVGKDWSQKPVATVDELKSSYQAGYNIGVRPGKWSCVQGAYLHVVDFDVRDQKFERQARSALYSVFPELDLDTCPTAISGSGGASRHFHFFSDKPFDKRIIAKSESKTDGKHDWQIELYGTGSNLVLPPSIHPSGQPYRWLRGYDWDSIDLMGPEIIPAEVIERILGDTVDQTEIGNVEPLGLTAAEVADLLADKPNDDLDYDEWLNVMAAVQHECANRSKEEKDEFFKVFREWSAKSKKYDYNRTRYKFFSFKNTDNRKLRTMRSIAAEVREIRLERSLDAEFEDLGDDLSDQGFEDLGPDDDEIFGDLLTDCEPEPQKAKRAKKPKWQNHEAPSWIQKMNQKHAVIVFGGKAFIMRFEERADGSEDHTLWDMKTFHDWYLSKPTVPVIVGKAKDGKPKIENLTISKAFMSSEFRRGYEEGYIFDTTGEKTDGYNLFRGWGVKPKKGSCSRILWHIEHVLCRGDKAAYDYFLDWLAHMFQRPEEIPRAAIVIRGEEGAGKDSVAKYLHKIVGRYQPRITGQDQFFGNFNGFLKNALFVNLQEAFIGSQQQNEKLKQYITEDVLKVENKYQNAVDTPNYMRIYITSNNFKVVAASESARRFLVLSAREDYASTGDPKQEEERAKYFDDLYDEMNGDGPAHLLHFLLERKLTNFPRTPPVTEELSNQVAHNWKGLKKFLRLAAQEGTFDLLNMDGDSEFRRRWIRHPIIMEKGTIRQAFAEWNARQPLREREELEVTATGLTKVLGQMMGAEVTRRKAGDKARAHCYAIPPLQVARYHMSKFARGRMVWGDEDEVQAISSETDDEKDDLQ